MQTEIQKSKHSLKYADFFKKYPYKKTTPGSYNSFCYVSTKERSNHQYALMYAEWREILKTYYDCILKYIATGNSYSFKSGIGVMEIRKFKSNKRSPDFNRILTEIMSKANCSYEEAKSKVTTEDIEKYKHYNLEIDGYRWILAWAKSSTDFRYKKMWLCRLNYKGWKEIDKIVKTGNNIQKIRLVNVNRNFNKVRI